MQSSLPPLPPLSAVQSITIPSDLDAVRSKLVQLIDVLSTLLAQLHYLSLTSPEPSTAHPGILPYTDLLNRYNLVLSHVSSLGALLSSHGDPREKDRKGKDRGRDPRKEKWDASAVAPATQVEADRDWVVGTLLRTKQTPQVEAHQADLLRALPPPFNDAETYPEALAAHHKLTEAAAARISAMKERDSGGHGDEWDWRGRVEVLDESEGEEDDAGAGGDQMDGIQEETPRPPVVPDLKRKWTLQEVATFQRTGRRPV